MCIEIPRITGLREGLVKMADEVEEVPSDSGLETLMGVHAVAEYLGVSVRTVWGLRAEGKFAPGTKIGKQIRWRESVLIDWLAASTEEPGESAVYQYRSAG